MPATCTACETAAGPTIRVEVDTINGPVRLALTAAQAHDLEIKVGQALTRWNEQTPE